VTDFEHARDRCGGAAFCAVCNGRMIEIEGRALRLAVQEALEGEHKTCTPDPDDRVIARVERYWRDSRQFRDRYRARL
jgi:hypothetical protein